MENKTVKIQAVDLTGVNVLEEGIAPSISIMSGDCCPDMPSPTEPGDTIPG